MNINLRLALTDSADACVVHVDAPEGTTLAELRARLPLFAGSGAQPLDADGTPVSDTCRLGVVPLVEGAMLTPARPRGRSAALLRLVVVSGPHQGAWCPLTAEPLVLGRGHPLIGDDPLASRHHARVRLSRGEVTVEDLSSSNGTALEGRTIRAGEAARWSAEGLVRIGASALRLEVTDEPCPPRPALMRLPTPTLIDWPSDPDAARLTPLRWVAALAPVPVAAVLAYVMHSPMMLCFMLLGPVVLVLTHLDDRRRGRSHGRSAQRDHDDATRRAALRAAEALRTEREALERLAPPPERLLTIALHGSAPPRSAEGTWILRLGHGDAPSRVAVRRRGKDGSEARDCLTHVEGPATHALAAGDTLHVDTDENTHQLTLELLTAQLGHSAVVGSARPLVLTPSALTHRWLWADGSPSVLVCATPPPHLAALLQDETPRPGSLAALPLVVLDADTEGAEGMARRLQSLGVTLIWVGSAPPPAPGTTSATPRARTHLLARAGHRAALLPSGHAFTLDSPRTHWFPTAMRLSHRHRHRTTDVAATATLDSVIHADQLLPSDVATAWEHPSTSVPIGRHAGGVMMLDLARTGPHALVAGTTGAGKSEFLLTYLRGLFAQNSPADVTALLIDYKGGATFGPLMHAPHVVGVITDLDAALAGRALTALRAEIKRRERVLAQAGVASFDAYRSTHREGIGLSRFFVIVDEFRALAEELPDFVPGLVRLAAVGRSLGMHLVLATQRPGGAVTADMRANLDVRVALRVRERSDSQDVIDTADAARISPRTPGRGYLATSGEPPIEFHSAYTGAPRTRATGSSLHVHTLRDQGGRVATNTDGCDGCAPAARTSASDLHLFVDEARLAAVGLAPPHRPLLPPLPSVVNAETLAGSEQHRAPLSGSTNDHVDLLDLLDLTQEDPTPAYQGGTCVAPDGLHVVGVADLPAAQRQPPVSAGAGAHIGIAGAPRSGRTTAAHAITGALVSAGATLWWVGGADDAGAAQDAFDPDVPDDVVRLLTALSDPPPHLCVAVDGWEDLHATLLRINHGSAVEDMHRLVSRGHALGVTFVITGARLVLASKLSALLDVKLVLRQNDPTEYSLAGLRPVQVPAHMPPGRALVLPYGHQIQLRCDAHAAPGDRTVG